MKSNMQDYKRPGQVFVSSKNYFEFNGHLFSKEEYRRAQNNGNKRLFTTCKREVYSQPDVFLPGGTGDYLVNCDDCITKIAELGLPELGQVPGSIIRSHNIY